MIKTIGKWYYVGSALEPGGLRVRIAHHARIAARPHWHIDYLRRHTPLTGVCTALIQCTVTVLCSSPPYTGKSCPVCECLSKKSPLLSLRWR